MNALVLMLIPATFGVDFGWERQPDNSIEYILQIEPEALSAMQTGTELVSSLPPSLRNIKDYRIRVGRDPLPNKNQIPPEFTTTGTNNNYAPTANNWGTSPPPNGINTGNYTGSNTGTGMTTMPTSTSGFPLEKSPNNYQPNTNQYLAGNTQPMPTPFPSATNPYNAATTQPNYNNAGYNPNTTLNNNYNTTPGYNTAPNYNTAGYNTNPNYNPANPASYNQPSPGYQQPNINNQYLPPGYQPQQQPYGQQQPQYFAQNTAPALGPGLGDPRMYGAAKIPDPMTPLATGTYPNNGTYTGTNTSGYPAGTQFTQPGATPAGSYPMTLGPPPGGYATNPQPGNGQLGAGQPGATIAANTSGQPQTTNTSATDPHQQTTGAKVEPTSAATSFAWLFVVLFLSIGANICFGYANFNLRERCRILMVDRAAY